MPLGWTSYVLGWISALLVGVSKTGLPGVAIPAVLLMTEAFPTDAKLGIGAMLPVLLVGDVFAVAWYRRHAQWDRLWKLFPSVILGMIPGGALLYFLSDGNQLRPIIGAVVLGLVVLEICRRRYDWQDVSHQWWFVLMIGALAGFSTIIAHAAGPVMVIYLLSQKLPKEQFIGTAAWFFFIVNMCKVPFYWKTGMVTPVTLEFGLAVVPAAVVGALLGIYVLKKIPQKPFEIIALVFAGVAAVWLIVV